MHNKILTILIIGSLIFTIAYLPPSVKAFTNVTTAIGTTACSSNCVNPIIVSGGELVVNDLLIIMSTCAFGTNAITSITDNSVPSQTWTLDKKVTLNTSPTPVSIPATSGSPTSAITTYISEIWSSRVTQVATITVNVNYAATNTGCWVGFLDANVNTPVYNNFASAGLIISPNPANNAIAPYTTTITPSGGSVNNYLAVYFSLYDSSFAQSGLACPGDIRCNVPIPATTIITNTISFSSGSSFQGGFVGAGYLFSTSGASSVIGTQIEDVSNNVGSPVLLLGALFATAGSVANCNALICSISESIPFTEGFGALGNLVVQLTDSLPFQEFTNLAHSLLVRIADSFTFLEQIPLVGPIFAQQIKDSFRLLDSLCIITFSCSFVTFTQPTPRTYVLTDNPIDYFVTIFMIPAIAIIGIIFLMRKGAEIPEHMVMPLILFAVLMIAWGGANTIFPASVSLLVILIAAAALAYYIADWFYGRLNRTGAMNTE